MMYAEKGEWSPVSNQHFSLGAPRQHRVGDDACRQLDPRQTVFGTFPKTL